jgi:DNA-binding MarR family transcriptional regulator
MGKLEVDMDTKFANEKHRSVANIVFTANWIKNQFESSIKPFKMSSAQFNILRILRGAKDWLSMNEVKKRMVEKSPNTTRLCDKLLDKGYIERTRSEADRRIISLKISDNGMQFLKKVDELGENNPLNFFENITLEEATTINHILDKLRG